MKILILGKSLNVNLGLSEPNELKDDRKKLEMANLLATVTHKTQVIKIGGERIQVKDTGYGREVSPL